MFVPDPTEQIVQSPELDSSSKDPRPPPVTPPPAPPQESVREEELTLIEVELTPEEQELLELGPKFALSRRVDEKLMDSIRVEIAAVRWLWSSEVRTRL